MARRRVRVPSSTPPEPEALPVPEPRSPVEVAARLRRLLLRAEAQIPASAIPEVTPSRGTAKLTVGMAAYDDYDGVYFTVQSLRVHHPEIQTDTEILVVDNHPEGPDGAALRRLEGVIPNYRYVPFRSYRGTAVRDVVFREAAGDYVLCVDAHVLIAPGAVKRLLDYFEEHRETTDLLQGPLLRDDLGRVSTHMDPVWREGMYGRWAADPLGAGPDQEAFEVPMQGLGLFACRRAAWLGFNPRFRGFGGEEGYIHEKYRRTGGRTLCLPFLRWLHRFERPRGVPYENTSTDRLRNYLIGWRELGLDDAPVIVHFTELLGQAVAARLIAVTRSEMDNPFSYFDAIYCINRADQPARWQQVERQFERAGLRRLVRRFEAVATPERHHVGVALSHRAVIEEARKLGLQHVLVLEDDVVFHRDVLAVLHPALGELRSRPWDLFYLGGCRWGQQTPELAPGCRFLAIPREITCTHALAYSRSSFDRLLAALPSDQTAMGSWIAQHAAIDQYFRELQQDWRCFITRPRVATRRALIAAEPEEERASFLA